MKSTFVHNSKGSAITTAAVTAAVLSILAAGYLSYMSNEYKLNYRSHRWTQALNLAEAAVEVGFAEFNYQYFQGGSGFQSTNGWSDLGGGSYSRIVSNFTDTTGRIVGDFTVTASGVGTANPQMLGVGTCANAPSGPTVSRGVRVTIKRSSRFPVGLMAKGVIDMNGNNIYTDSFDSTDVTKSTGGQYDASKKQANGDIATLDAIANSVNIGQADIYGQVYTGPSAGSTVTIGANGSVGPTFNSAARATSATTGEADGYIRKDFDVDIPDVKLPSGLNSAPSLGTIDNDATITGGDHTVDSISLSGSKVLTISGDVRLYVTNSISLTGNASIILTAGSSLQVYVGGNVVIGGQGIVNQPGDAAKLEFFGLPTSTSWNVNGNGQWIGNIYAPQANMTLNGGGSQGNMSGSMVVSSITLDGKVSFHYDESLKASDTGAAYVIASWQALKYQGGAWVPE